MNTIRLLKLADVLDNLKAELQFLVIPNVRGFNLGDWHCHLQTDEPSCGTVACGCGTAMLHPWFREQGFITDDEADYKTEPSVSSIPWFDGAEGFEAAEKFFEIDEEAADYLFSPSYCEPEDLKDEKKLAARIREFVAADGVVPSDASSSAGFDEDE